MGNKGLGTGSGSRTRRTLPCTFQIWATQGRHAAQNAGHSDVYGDTKHLFKLELFLTYIVVMNNLQCTSDSHKGVDVWFSYREVTNGIPYQPSIGCVVVAMSLQNSVFIFVNLSYKHATSQQSSYSHAVVPRTHSESFRVFNERWGHSSTWGNVFYNPKRFSERKRIGLRRCQTPCPLDAQRNLRWEPQSRMAWRSGGFHRWKQSCMLLAFFPWNWLDWHIPKSGVLGGSYTIHGIYRMLPDFERPVRFARHKVVTVRFVLSCHAYLQSADNPLQNRIFKHRPSVR